MSQNPNSGPNYNPYEQNPSNPNYPPNPNTAYGGSQPPSGPNSGYGQYAPPPPPGPDNTPNSGYGQYAPPPPSTPMPPAPDPMSGPYGPYDQTVMSQQNSSPGYPTYGPPSNPNLAPLGGLPPVPPMPSQPPRSNARAVLIAVAALLIILLGVLGVVLYNSHQTAVAHDNATATANANVQSTAQAVSKATASAQATATYVKSHYPFSTNQVLNDPLTDASNVSKYGWDVDNYCSFANGTYQDNEPNSQHVHLCMANTPTYDNFTYEVQMAIKSGGNGAQGGVLFRADLLSDKFYILYIDTKGNYDLDIEVNNEGNNNRTLKSGTVPGYATGFFQVHTIGIVANGSQITLYVDKNQVAQVTDSTYTSGQIGVISSYGASTTLVDYNNAKVWQL